VSNADWYARKLGQTVQQPQAQPGPPPLQPPSQTPMAPFPQFQQPQQPAGPPSSRNSAVCPECNSGNYMQATPTTGFRCYDCGYPIEQSGSRYGALQGARVEGSVRSSLGNDGTSNWNPQGIIGRIDG
jgi:hypothetical protein